jgi:hypothetical protein
MKKVLLIISSFVLISIGLTWFWNEWARVSYAHLFNAVAPPIYELIGFEHARVVGFRERYINFVPFVSLLLVTPGLTLRRRTIGLSLGVFFIFLCHLALNLTELLQPGLSLPIVPAIVSDALPFLVWIIVAYPVLTKFLVVEVEPEANGDAAKLPTTTEGEGEGERRVPGDGDSSTTGG